MDWDWTGWLFPVAGEVHEQGFLGCFAETCGHWSERWSQAVACAHGGRGSEGLEFPEALSAWAFWEAGMPGFPVLRSGFGLVDKYWKLCFYPELFNPHCLPSPLPRLILGVGRWLQATTLGRFGKSQPLGEGWERTWQWRKEISEVLWVWLKLSASPESGGLSCNVFNSWIWNRLRSSPLGVVAC